EAVEADGDRFEIEDSTMTDVDALRHHAAGAHAAAAIRRSTRKKAFTHDLCFSHSPAMPRGKNSVTKMNNKPSTNSQYSGSACVNQLLPRLTTAAPSTGP